LSGLRQAMNTPNSRQPVWHRIARIALSIMQVLMPLSAGILDKKQVRFWQALPLRRMAALLPALFLVVGAWGFFLDLTEWKRLPLWALLVYSSLFGTAGVVFFVMMRRRVAKLIPLFVILVTAIVYVPRWLPHGPHIPVSDLVRARIALDAICIMASTLLGYRLFLLFINTQGLEQVRTRAELDLAYGMQQMLVPPITYRTESFEAYGVSLPSEEVGGDLVDLIPTKSGWIACLADVSGHGIQASLLMGNLKTALRFGFAQGQSLPDVIAAVCRVLPEVKPAEMYATFAGLRFSGRGRVEYLIAGHPAILHYHAADRRAERRGMEQFPLGLTGDCAYESATTSYDPGDLFVLLSDGVIETENAHGLEFGFEGVEQSIVQHGADPLKEIMNRLMTELASFGDRADDQTILLIRALA
jgi:serine phosphatase RsbU (regulator of sigma subunit)